MVGDVLGARATPPGALRALEVRGTCTNGYFHFHLAIPLT